MKKLRDVTTDEMIAVFLRGEINSDRWGERLLFFLNRDDVDRKVIDNPDITNKMENEYRKKLLSEFRGYKRNKYLFIRFPNDVTWVRAEVSKQELKKVLFVAKDYWAEITDGTRLPHYLAKRIKSGDLPDDENVLRFKAVARALQQGAIFPELILVAEDESSRIVALEGHVRLAAYLLAPKYIPEKLEVIIGYSKNMPRWKHY